MNRKPENFRELNHLIETSSRWFEKSISCEEVKNIRECEDGDLNTIYIIADVQPDLPGLDIYERRDYAYRIQPTEPNYVSCNMKPERTYVVSFNHFDDFKKSEWYDKCIDAFSSGYCDESLSEDVFEAVTDPTSAYIHASLIGYHKDWLGNSRPNDVPDKISMELYSDETLSIVFNDESYEADIYDFISAYKLVNALKDKGIEFEDSGKDVSIKIKYPEKED